MTEANLKTRTNKIAIAMRLSPDLLKLIDIECERHEIPTRTAFIEKACLVYTLHLM